MSKDAKNRLWAIILIVLTAILTSFADDLFDGKNKRILEFEEKCEQVDDNTTEIKLLKQDVPQIKKSVERTEERVNDIYNHLIRND